MISVSKYDKIVRSELVSFNFCRLRVSRDSKKDTDRIISIFIFTHPPIQWNRWARSSNSRIDYANELIKSIIVDVSGGVRYKQHFQSLTAYIYMNCKKKQVSGSDYNLKRCVTIREQKLADLVAIEIVRGIAYIYDTPYASVKK